MFARLTDARSGLTVSGDFYDFIPLTDDRVGIVIGDVSGKGMPAALLMTSVRASVRAWTNNGYCASEEYHLGCFLLQYRQLSTEKCHHREMTLRDFGYCHNLFYSVVVLIRNRAFGKNSVSMRCL
jgi:hypothetical protein